MKGQLIFESNPTSLIQCSQSRTRQHASSDHCRECRSIFALNHRLVCVNDTWGARVRRSNGRDYPRVQVHENIFQKQSTSVAIGSGASSKGMISRKENDRGIIVDVDRKHLGINRQVDQVSFAPKDISSGHILESLLDSSQSDRSSQDRAQTEGARVQAEIGFHAVRVYDNVGKLIGKRLGGDNPSGGRYQRHSGEYSRWRFQAVLDIQIHFEGVDGRVVHYRNV
ncbi:hypothetical protein C8R45DRAFT_970723 [Mycena sanguinolenta]|nr:hypothetical protein C8R45DRAFT_970723 [Mycena sanguinolenta]